MASTICRQMLAVTVMLAWRAPAAAAQARPDERSRIIAVADSALAAISRNDFIGFTDLMTDSAVVYGIGPLDGKIQVSARSRAAWRTTVSKVKYTERGFRPVVHISGPLAVVWTPYDFYGDAKWSHCGVDTFTLAKVGDTWRIASLSYSIEQPPACEKNPAGPPKP